MNTIGATAERQRSGVRDDSGDVDDHPFFAASPPNKYAAGDFVAKKTNDVAFSLRDDRYKKAIIKYADIIDSETGSTEKLRSQNKNNGNITHQEAKKELRELKGGGGYLLKPIHSGKGNSPVVGYSHFESDEEALKSKLHSPHNIWSKQNVLTLWYPALFRSRN